MPRIGRPSNPQEFPGTLRVAEVLPNVVEALYIPSPERVEKAELSPDDDHSVRLLTADARGGFLTVYPTRTTGKQDVFLKPKYQQVDRITFADGGYLDFGEDLPSSQEDFMLLLEDLPTCFVKDFDWGLGLTKKYRHIITAIEASSECTEILITVDDAPVSVSGQTLRISTSDFTRMRKGIDKVTRSRDSDTLAIVDNITHSFVTDLLGKPRRSTSPTLLQDRLWESAFGPQRAASEETKEAALNVVEKNARTIAEERPERLESLSRSIELVNLDNRIASFQRLLNSDPLEREWQDFLNDNPFILSLAFGHPVLKVRDQASVGGRKLSGKGDNITDFLVKNKLTNNCAIVEIKRSGTRLLNNTPRNGVHTPSGRLVGAVNQALAQKYRFEKEVAQIKDNSGIYDITSYSVSCCLLIGKMPGTEDRQRSLELYRGNSKDVEILTYSELLEKLKQFREFLETP